MDLAFWFPADELCRLGAMRKVLAVRGIAVYPQETIIPDGAQRQWVYAIKIDNVHGDHLILTAPGTNENFAAIFHATTLLSFEVYEHRPLYRDSSHNIAVYFEPYSFVVIRTLEGLDAVLRLLRVFTG